MWNLEKWYRLSVLQNRNTDRDTENKCIDTKRGNEDVMNWETVTDVHTLWILCTKWITNEKLL